MAFSKSDSSSIYSRRAWQKNLQKKYGKKAPQDDNACGHVWQWDPEDRLMRCFKCGQARLPTDADKLEPRMEGTGTDF